MPAPAAAPAAAAPPTAAAEGAGGGARFGCTLDEVEANGSEVPAAPATAAPPANDLEKRKAYMVYSMKLDSTSDPKKAWKSTQPYLVDAKGLLDPGAICASMSISRASKEKPFTRSTIFQDQPSPRTKRKHGVPSKDITSTIP